ncbi:MAG TPA: D-2-hydroxyacid dehydrogenase [Abditibacteriaceae bacterium]|jgi:glycerate dehydrogenase
MRIVVLDGHTLNPGDLSWSALQALGDCIIYDRTCESEVVTRAAEAQVVLTNKTVVTGAAMRALPQLRYIGVLATGYNVVDTEAARERHILVTNVPAYGTASVAQATFALLLELVNAVGHHDLSVHQGRWTSCPDFSYSEKPLVELAGLKLGIIGLGTIGQAVAHIAQAFGMEVLAHSRTPRDVPQIHFVDLKTLLTTSDIISLHCPLTPDTREIINTSRLRQMKPSGFLLNTSRGPLIDERALAHALNHDHIAGAGLDVLSVEPPTADNPLLQAKNCIITPHIAWATRAARQRLLDTAVANLLAFQQGQATNVVNSE